MKTIEPLLERIAAQNEEMLRLLSLRFVERLPEPDLKKPKSN